MRILKKWKCSIRDYPTEIKLSEKRKATYYKIGEAPPKKYGGVFFPDKDGHLLDDRGEKILKNTKTAGKPRMMSINLQRLYVGCHHSVRSKIVNEMHEMLSKEFKKQFPEKIEIPEGCKIIIHLHFYDIYNSKIPDLDNLAGLFLKTGIDCLTTANNPNQIKAGEANHKLGIIPDDKIEFIPGIVSEFTNVEKQEDRKLDFDLYLVEGKFKIENLLDKEL